MISKVPLNVFTVGLAILAVSSFFVKPNLPRDAVFAFELCGIFWGVATVVRAVQAIRALRQQKASS